MHPADLLEKNDLGANQNHSIERMNVDLKTKEMLMREVFDLFRNSKRPIITMKEMVLNFIAEKERQFLTVGHKSRTKMDN
jgi:hypothetical protein